LRRGDVAFLLCGASRELRGNGPVYLLSDTASARSYQISRWELVRSEGLESGSSTEASVYS